MYNPPFESTSDETSITDRPIHHFHPYGNLLYYDCDEINDGITKSKYKKIIFKY